MSNDIEWDESASGIVDVSEVSCPVSEPALLRLQQIVMIYVNLQNLVLNCTCKSATLLQTMCRNTYAMCSPCNWVNLGWDIVMKSTK